MVAAKVGGGSVGKVRKLIQQGVDVNHTDMVMDLLVCTVHVYLTVLVCVGLCIVLPRIVQDAALAAPLREINTALKSKYDMMLK